MSFGTKYREAVNMKPEEIKAIMYDYIDKFAQSKSNKFNINTEDFTTWKDRIKEVISNRIRFFETNKPYLFFKNVSVFEDREVKESIKYLHKRFILVVADKAANNFVIICKKFYVITLINELGIDIDTFTCLGNSTYKIVDRNENDIIKEHINIIKNQFNIICPEKEQVVPKIFWNAKLHKSPYKARFIAGARLCTTKRLSVKINKALQVVKNSFFRYCKAIYRHTGINFDWSISSSLEFLKRLNALEIWSMQVFDFTTLYTSLDLKEVENALFGLIDLLFSSHNKYICIGFQKSFFSKKKYRGYYSFDNQSLKHALKFIINNTFIAFGGYILNQVKGIPMGGNCSSPMADLTLSYKEFVFMSGLMKEKKIRLARLLSNNCRYIDDISIINYNNFSTLVPVIYPSDLKVERSGDDNKEVQYLDIKVNINTNELKTTVYNKVDDFTFPVVTFTYPSSNIPIHVGYNVFYSQVLRYSRICSTKESFISKTKHTFQILKTRGYEERILVKYFKKVFDRDQFILYKYGYSYNQQAVDEIIEQ